VTVVGQFLTRARPSWPGRVRMNIISVSQSSKVHGTRKPATIVWQVGYNEVVGIRQARKSLDCFDYLSLDTHRLSVAMPARQTASRLEGRHKVHQVQVSQYWNAGVRPNFVLWPTSCRRNALSLWIEVGMDAQAITPIRISISQ
jgi:hypothetical protein